jgi:hypothetical protein
MLVKVTPLAVLTWRHRTSTMRTRRRCLRIAVYDQVLPSKLWRNCNAAQQWRNLKCNYRVSFPSYVGSPKEMGTHWCSVCTQLWWIRYQACGYKTPSPGFGVRPRQQNECCGVSARQEGVVWQRKAWWIALGTAAFCLHIDGSFLRNIPKIIPFCCACCRGPKSCIST